jgi:hypothetical protein
VLPCGRWRRLTLIGALDLGGLAAAMTVAAPTTTGVFLAFVERVLAPAPRERPGALVVMDDLAPHNAAIVHDAIRAAGLEPRLLPGIMEQTHLAACGHTRRAPRCVHRRGARAGNAS